MPLYLPPLSPLTFQQHAAITENLDLALLLLLLFFYATDVLLVMSSSELLTVLFLGFCVVKVK